VSFPQKSVPRRAQVTPIILAAGASSRMGQRKECLKFGEVTCLDLALSNCDDASLGTPILVTREERKFRLETEFLTKRKVITLAINPQPELGQTSSLLAGLKLLPADARAFLIYPVDFPLVRAGDIDRLYESYVKEPSGTLVVAPSFQRRRGHPVLVDASLAPALLALPAGGSARDVLAAHAGHTRYVDCNDDRLLVDMDTPEDYARCLARYVFGG
jgi:molybdenum cofactor cytidylyltransferase